MVVEEDMNLDNYGIGKEKKLIGILTGFPKTVKTYGIPFLIWAGLLGGGAPIHLHTSLHMEV